MDGFFIAKLKKYSDGPKMKADIKNLGSVNVNAIEEYKEVKERYDFMSA